MANIIECVAWGDFDENTYVAGDGDACCIIDPGAPAAELTRAIRGRKVSAILLTHTHLDHIFGADEVREKTGAPLIAPANEADGLTDPRVNLSAAFNEPFSRRAAEKTASEGTEVVVGTVTLRAVEVPGHSKGHLAWIGPGFVVTGDTLFAGAIGRTDLPGSSYEQLIKSIREKLMTLPDETVVYPGHGPSTTIGTERRFNPFVA